MGQAAGASGGDGKIGQTPFEHAVVETAHVAAVAVSRRTASWASTQ